MAGPSAPPNLRDELAQLREELQQLRNVLPEHVDVDPDRAERDLAKLVLSLVEFIRQLLERQAVRRMEAGTVSDDEIERMGLALMRLREKVHELARQFGLQPSDLDLNLGARVQAL
jgi:hypothetical protein